MKNKLMIIMILFLSNVIFSQIKVVASTTVIYDLVKEIGKDKVSADYIARGDQDPHSVEVLPSYMLKLRKADIFFKVGMSLELWADQLVDGSRNTSLKIIELSQDIDKKDVPTFKPNASYGDVHPYGNPHYWLDPENAKIMANEICNSLSEESEKDKDYFKKNLDDFNSRIDKKMIEWNSKMAEVKSKPFIFFHASWIYFADRFGIKIAGYVEPKPGITPSPSHNAELVQLIKSKGIKYIVMDNFYSDSAPNQLASLTGAKVVKVPTAVFGMKGADSYIQLIDFIINRISS